MEIPAKLASAKCIAEFFFNCLFFVFVFIYLFIYLFVCLLVCFLALLIEHDGFFYAEQSKDVFSSEIHMLNGPEWSKRDHADWYTVLTDPANDD